MGMQIREVEGRPSLTSQSTSNWKRSATQKMSVKQVMMRRRVSFHHKLLENYSEARFFRLNSWNVGETEEEKNLFQVEL